MQRFVRRLGVVPVLLLSVGLFLLGVLAVDRIVNTMWLFDVSQIDLARAVVQQRADAPTLLGAANNEVLVAFLASIIVAVTGLVMVPMYYVNKRFNPPGFRDEPPVFLSVLRQSMFFGFWAAFCVWLQMNRTLGLAVALLAGAVLILFELVLQIRERATAVTEQGKPVA
jgi:membrane-associated HD superfamily phosphohydrolase